MGKKSAAYKKRLEEEQEKLNLKTLTRVKSAEAKRSSLLDEKKSKMKEMVSDCIVKGQKQRQINKDHEIEIKKNIKNKLIKAEERRISMQKEKTEKLHAKISKVNRVRHVSGDKKVEMQGGDKIPRE